MQRRLLKTPTLTIAAAAAPLLAASSGVLRRPNLPQDARNEPFGPALKALPKLDVKATCRRAQPLSGLQTSYQGCLNDETDAQRELSRTWFDFKPGPRSTCTRVTNIGGAPSYVEVLTCLQLDKQAGEASIENKKQLNMPQTPTE